MPTDVFTIATANDDGTGYRTSTVWATISSGAFTAEATTNIWASQTFGTPNYFVDNAYLRFNTATIPDGAVISSATLTFWLVSKADTDARSLAGDYYDFLGEPSDSGDWVREITSSIFTPITLASIGTGAFFNPALTNLSGINVSGYTGIRLALSTSTVPTGGNEVQLASFEEGAHIPQLSVTYTVVDPIAPKQGQPVFA